MNKPVAANETSAAAPVAMASTPAGVAAQTTYAVIFAISASHFLNDLMQSLIPSLYPVLKQNYALDFGQIGLITLAFQLTSSLLQPLVGIYTDRTPRPFSLAAGMGITLIGLVMLGFASNYPMILLSAALVGTGSAVFHPEASRIARLASGGRFGFAQSTFQVGGNFGTALGPVLAALIIVPLGQHAVSGFAIVALLAMAILWRIGVWYKPRIVPRKAAQAVRPLHDASPRMVTAALVILVALLFSKTFYLASITSYYTFYLMHKFGVSTQAAQLYLFAFLAASAVGVFFGGPLGDRFGRKHVIWFSILGVLPFTLALPYASLPVSVVLTVIIGFILSSAMPAIVVFAQELMPHRVGMISGLFFGFTFGLGGIGAALLGELADLTSIDFVYQVCAFLPAIGMLAIFLPKIRRAH